MKQFYVTSLITIEAENFEEAVKKLNKEGNKEIAYALLGNAEVDEHDFETED